MVSSFATEDLVPFRYGRWMLFGLFELLRNDGLLDRLVDRLQVVTITSR